MLHPGIQVFFRLPSESSARILHPGKVLTVDGQACTASLVNSTLPITPKQEMLLYYDIRNKFSQQQIRIDAFLESRPERVIGFTTLSEPVSAESRQCFRVVAAVAGLTARIGPQDGAAIVDVSATGFSVIAAGSYSIGQSVPVSFVHAGKQYAGTATVQSALEMEPGRVRYGLFCASARGGTSGDLQKGLAQLSTSLQRAQLRRMAGG